MDGMWMDGVSGWKKDSVNITKISNLGCGLVFCFQENQAGLSPCVSYKVEGMVLTKTARGVS